MLIYNNLVNIQAAGSEKMATELLTRESNNISPTIFILHGCIKWFANPGLYGAVYPLLWNIFPRYKLTI